MKKIIYLIILAALPLLFLSLQIHADDRKTGVLPTPFGSKSVAVKSNIDHSGITIKLHPPSSYGNERPTIPAELLMTDHQGRRTGYDPLTASPA